MANEPRFRATNKLLEDGRLQNDRAEGFAILLAEGIEQQEAWIGSGGKGTDSSRRYRNKQMGERTFKSRLVVLMEDRAEVERVGGSYQDAKWAAKQAYRVAAMRLDYTVMSRQADLLFKIAQAEGAPAPEMPVVPGKVGKPSVEAPLSGKRNPAAIREALMNKGTRAADPRATQAQEDD